MKVSFDICYFHTLFTNFLRIFIKNIKNAIEKQQIMVYNIEQNSQLILKTFKRLIYVKQIISRRYLSDEGCV